MVEETQGSGGLSIDGQYFATLGAAKRAFLEKEQDIMTGTWASGIDTKGQWIRDPEGRKFYPEDPASAMKLYDAGKFEELTRLLNKGETLSSRPPRPAGPPPNSTPLRGRKLPLGGGRVPEDWQKPEDARPQSADAQHGDGSDGVFHKVPVRHI